MSEYYTAISKGVTVKLDYDGGENVIYFGETIPGTAVSKSFWRIRKFTYDGNDNVTDIKWANANALTFTVKWDDRATYTYS